jgi:hypothetical protein
MKIHPRVPRAPAAHRGAALMLSLFVLFVLILIISQISYSTKTDERVARNEEALTSMDQAVESVLLQVYDDLLSDAESGSPGAGGASGAAASAFASETPGGGGGQGPTDSHEDGWSHPQRTEMNGLQVRVLIQDEDSKFNLLSILTQDEVQAEKSFERLVRVIANARKGTRAEIDEVDARRMATAIQEYMKRRRDQALPKAPQLSDLEADEDLGLPFVLEEFCTSMPELFQRSLFDDFRDEDDRIVHGLSSFLTVHSSLAAASDGTSSPGGGAPAGDGAQSESGSGTQDQGAQDEQQGAQQNPAAGVGGAGAPGGETPLADGRINVNTAPLAVLAGLFDTRDVPARFWDEVLEYRNEPQEDEDGSQQDEDELPLDEFGEPIVPKKIFSSFEDLTQLDSWLSIEPAYRAEMRGLLKTHSSVFSIYVTARKPTGEEKDLGPRRREEIEREEAEGPALVRTVRSIAWRRQGSDGAEIVPLLRWQVIDYVPYEVLDSPDERR